MALLRQTPHRTAILHGILKSGNPVHHWVPVAAQMFRTNVVLEPGTPHGSHAQARWCSKSQLIDLVAEGFSEEVLDNEQPNIVVSDWYCGRTDAGCLYELSVELQSDTRDVISEYKSDTIAIPQSTESVWSEVTHTFSGYGPGVRFVKFMHGGQDSVFWKGWFGVRVTNSSVKVEA